MALASIVSITAHLGLFGPLAQAFSALIALGTAFITSPLIAWATRGKYYIARSSGMAYADAVAGEVGAPSPGFARPPEGVQSFLGRPGERPGTHPRYQLKRCAICEREYEGPDMAHCPAYQGPICSLCCTLDARCGDMCKPHASLSAQWSATLHWLLPRSTWPALDKGLGYFLLLMLVIVPLLASVFGLLYHQELRALAEAASDLPLFDSPQAALRWSPHMAKPRCSARRRRCPTSCCSTP